MLYLNDAITELGLYISLCLRVHVVSHMESLSTAMSGLNISQKRSFFDAFMDEEAKETSSSKNATRMELAPAVMHIGHISHSGYAMMMIMLKHYRILGLF